MYYLRKLYEIIKSNFFKEKIITLYGARRTGKTTLVKRIIGDAAIEAKYVNFDLIQFRNALRFGIIEKLFRKKQIGCFR